MKLTTIKIQKQKLERWKDIQNYEGLYRISSLGRVKSLERKVKHRNSFRTIKEKIMKLNKNKYGYLCVNLFKNGKGERYCVHRLVTSAFISNPENKPCIDHINTIKTDNRVKNLHWVNHKENMNNPLSIKKKQGEKNPMARKVRCIETGEVFNTLKQACEWCGKKSASDIAKQIRGELKSTGTHPETGQKLTWEYVIEETIEINLDLNIFVNGNIDILV